MRRTLCLLIVAALTIAHVESVGAAGACAILRSWTDGQKLNGADLTNSFTRVGQTNMTYQCLDDYSSDLTQMQVTTDPYPASVASLATTGAGELERLRYVIKTRCGQTQWYTYTDTCVMTTNLTVPKITRPGANLTLETTTSGDIVLSPAGNVTWSNSLLPSADGTQDLGSTTKRVQTAYVGTSVVRQGANGQSSRFTCLTEQTTLSGATTSSAIQFPANSSVVNVTVRVTTSITGATTFDLGDAAASTRYGNAYAIASGTTGVTAGLGSTNYDTATAVLYTANGSAFTGGVVRLTLCYFDGGAPTS